jgi:magnesium-transporting ATPase (P-type)
MKFCTKCGQQIHDEAVICVHCGCAVAPIQPAAPAAPAEPVRPTRQLKTNRALWKVIVFSMITFGIYPLVVMSAVSSDINTIAHKYDGKRTMHFMLVLLIFSWLTFGIAPFVWIIKLSSRIGRELKRRGISYGFGAGTFWLWAFLGSMIVVGPYIYIHKMLKSMNLLAADYNEKG